VIGDACQRPKTFVESAKLWGDSGMRGGDARMSSALWMPSPSAQHASLRTMRATEGFLPSKSVPRVSRSEPRQAMYSSCRQGPPLGWPLARRVPQPTQPRWAQYQGDQHQLVEKEMSDHGNTPSYKG